MDLLREYVVSSGVRIEEVARKIGVTGRTIYNWVEGRGKISPLASEPLNAFLSTIPAKVKK
jgi:transposase-like protein